MQRDKDFSFFYPMIPMQQEAFREDGTRYTAEVVSEGKGHILYQGRLMCGESMNIIKTRLKTKKHSIKKQRVADKKLCQDCLEKYKKNEDSAWSLWERGEAVHSDVVIKLAE